MPAATTVYPFRPELTNSEIAVVWRYMQRKAEKTGFHLSLHEALEKLLRLAIERERENQK